LDKTLEEKLGMPHDRLYVDGQILCKGVELAMSRSEEPVLCLFGSDTVSFIAVSGLRLVVSWRAGLERPAPKHVAFLIPPLVAELLSSNVICSQVGVELIVRNQDVVARLTDHLGRYDICWEFDVASYPAPEAFGRLITVPSALVEVSHIGFSDATHRSVAKLVRMEADKHVSPSKLAILIDVQFGRLRIEGEEIASTGSRQYYFDPRLVMRAMEFLKVKLLKVGITPLMGGGRGYLSLLAEQDGWTVHCALLSIGKDTQRLYPLPPGRNR
jgi:hypothetical protein